MTSHWTRLALVCVSIILLAACTTRQLQDSLAGATAQQLVTHSIDDLARSLPATDFAPHAGKRVQLTSHFLQSPEIQAYADRRLAVELARRFDMTVVDDPEQADVQLEVFYTALGTDRNTHGLVIPLGFMPGVDQTTQIDLISLEQFHGVAEMYYFLGETTPDKRGDVLQARTRTDAIGLPVITIPVSTIDRSGEGGD